MKLVQTFFWTHCKKERYKPSHKIEMILLNLRNQSFFFPLNFQVTPQPESYLFDFSRLTSHLPQNTWTLLALFCIMNVCEHNHGLYWNKGQHEVELRVFIKCIKLFRFFNFFNYFLVYSQQVSWKKKEQITGCFEKRTPIAAYRYAVVIK